ncbi:MAG: uracil-DNA glycosylase [Coriobacteriia bacterium]|nr:uracil-DNA glycosylase [Coriobacteriia bacterium]
MSDSGNMASIKCGSLDELRDFIGDCQRCPLARTRTNLVFGVGDPHARLMFIGEAPGRNEDLQGEPFVGAAGKLLDELLASIGLVRSEVYIANVLKCRPPGNRDPLPEEMEQCTPFLEEQVRLVDPEVIATLGNFATRHVLKTQAGITRLRGRLFRVDGRKVVPIYHPAAALYDRTKQDVLFADFQRLKAVLESFDETARAVQGASEGVGQGGGTDDSGIEQPTLF